MFCFYSVFIKTALYKSSLFSEKKKIEKKKSKAKQRQMKESLTMIPIFAFQFRALCIIVQLEVSHVINK